MGKAGSSEEISTTAIFSRSSQEPDSVVFPSSCAIVIFRKTHLLESNLAQHTREALYPAHAVIPGKRSELLKAS
jgi:hypothetical protein